MKLSLIDAQTILLARLFFYIIDTRTGYGYRIDTLMQLL